MGYSMHRPDVDQSRWTDNVTSRTSRLLRNATVVLAGLFCLAPVNAQYGGPDVNLITGPETMPNVTQNTTSAWGHGNTVVVAYVDSSGAPFSFTGVSVSTDGGATFTRIPEKFNEGGPGFGQASVLYSRRAKKWYLTSLSGRCGPLGISQWVSADGFTWTPGACLYAGANGNLPFTWVDNNPVSPYYGRQYVLFNEFDSPGGTLRFRLSDNEGVSWSAPMIISPAFRRAVGATGSLAGDGTVFIQAMEEGVGGKVDGRMNVIYRSTDGGTTWSGPIPQGPPFLLAGRIISQGWPGMYAQPVPGYWTEYGLGQAGVGPGGVVHYIYAAHGPGLDPGDILYVRSIDNGLSWSAPMRLNTDTTIRGQWGPSLCVSASGAVFASWYDERNTTDESLQRFGRASLDNGATWQPDAPLSDVAYPKPLQPDPNIRGTLVGYFNHAAFSDDGYGATALHGWTDGRVSIGGVPQQDIFFDRVPLGLPMSVIAPGSVQVLNAGTNGTLDPGETVTVVLGVRNAGGAGACTANLAGTLQATGGVTAPTPAAQVYGTLCTDGPETQRTFSFVVDPALACGDTVTVSLDAKDGATDYGTLVWHLPVGESRPVLTEDFDGVVAPALPPGWTATSLGGGSPLWVTSTATSDTPPNAAFAPSTSTAADNALDTPTFVVQSAGAHLRFRNYSDLGFRTEGAVLEVSSPNIQDGAFTDITADEIQASFEQGGYNDAIPTTVSSPLAGRRAWTGQRGVYLDTVVKLGPKLAGWPIRLRFRMATPGIANFGGWRIDGLSVTEPVCAPRLTVTTADDHDDGICSTGDCTLREAINAAADGDTIGFQGGIGPVIQLGSALPNLSRRVAIAGPGADRLTVRRNTGGAYRLFTIDQGVAARLSGLTLANGDAGADFGGAIMIGKGALTLNDCVVTGNHAQAGGALFVQGSPSGSASAVLTGCTLSDNAATGGFSIGGTIFSQGTDNGAAYVGLTNCTVSGNSAALAVSGVYSFGTGGTATLDIRNSTFNGNGVMNDHGLLSLANSAFRASADATVSSNGGTSVSLGHNLASDGGGGLLNGPGDVVNVDPKLDPAGLANNGGPTLTIALLAGSPAINAGDDGLAPPTDQRGYLRSGISDIGAYEFGGFVLQRYTRDDVLKALRVAGGLVAVSSSDMARLDVVPGSGVTVDDALRIARKVAGLEANP